MGEVLFADDDAAMRQMVSDLLRAAGFTVRLATNGRAALEEIRRAHPDLAVLDYRMGIPNGFDVCREVKGDPRLEHIPLLILTAEGQIDHRVRAFDVGADDFLAKPFDPRELVARCRALLRLARQGLDRNPTTGLPGGDAVRREMEHRFAQREPFCLCYFDLDHFKPFHDRFGFVVADEVIRAAGKVLREAAEGSSSFVGHIGGDDFVLLATPAEARPQAMKAQAGLRKALQPHIPPEIAAAGSYRSHDRDGIARDFPLTRLSVAIVTIDAARGGSLNEFSQVIAEVKLSAKQSPTGIAEVSVPPSEP